MRKKFSSFYTPVVEKDEHKTSKEYKKLSPRMKDAVNFIFSKMINGTCFPINITIVRTIYGE